MAEICFYEYPHLLPRLPGGPLNLGVDTETTGLDILVDPITAIVIAYGETAYVIDARRYSVSDIRDWWSTQVAPHRLHFHNAQFDCVRLARQYGVTIGEPFCCRWAETVLTSGLVEDDDRGQVRKVARDLKSCASRHLGIELSKDHEIRTGFQLDNMWSDEQIEYAGMDALVLVPLANKQREEAQRLQLTDTLELEMACVPVFVEMELRGVYVDEAVMRPLLNEAEVERDRHRETLSAELTKFMAWSRMRRQEGNDAKVREWQRRLDEFAALQGELWDRHNEAGTVAELSRDWVGVVVGTNPITDEDGLKWADTVVPKGKTEPAGKTRYVKKMTQHWRTVEGNARPVVQKVSIDAPINLRSPQQKAAAMTAYCEEYNREHATHIEPPPNFKKNTLAGWAIDLPDEIHSTIVVPLREFTRRSTLLSSFGEPLLSRRDESGVIRTQWNQYGTNTGRVSTSKPNLQAMPSKTEKRYRRGFRARPGHKFIIADYSQLELRILAQISGDPVMITAFRDGRDLHLETAAAIFGVPMDKVTSDQRRFAKIINFGSAYGMRERALMRNAEGEGVRLSFEDAKRYLDQWRSYLKVAWAWIEKTGRDTVRNGYSLTAFGRRRWFDVPEGWIPPYILHKIEREGGNHPIQGTAADIAKLAMAMIQPELLALGGSIVLQIHDEIVAEVPEQCAEESLAIVAEGMRLAGEAFFTEVPCTVDACVSPSWDESEAELHYEKAA